MPVILLMIVFTVSANNAKAQLCHAALKQQLHIGTPKLQQPKDIQENKTRYHPRTGEPIKVSREYTIYSPGHFIECRTAPIRFGLDHEPFRPMNTTISGEDLKHSAEP